MQVSDLVVEVRNANYERVGQLRPQDLVGSTFVLRYNDIGSWKVVLPVGHRLADELAAPGAGLIVTTEGGTLLSGPTRSVTTNQSEEDPEGTYEITGVDDSIVLDERLAYPTPTTADVTAQTAPYDIRTGVAETVIKDYVTANIGATAPVARRIAELTVEASENRGPSIRASARFDKLQELLKGLGDVSGLGYTIEQEGNGLVFKVYQPVDRTATVRMDIENGKLTKSTYSYSAPRATRAIVGGDGEDALRVFQEVVTTDATTAESQWKRRVEVFVDQRNTTNPTELTLAGQELLVKDGKTLISVSISPSDDQTMRFGIDWFLGDKVTCVVGPTELQSIVTEVGIAIATDGVRIGATVGEPRFLGYESQILTKQADTALRLSKLERK